MAPKVAALSREVLDSALTSAGMAAQDIRALLRRDAWRGPDSRNSQVIFFWAFSQSDGTIRFGTSDIAEIFNIQDHHVSSIRHKGYLKKKLTIVHRSLTHIKTKMSFTSFKTYGWLRTFLDRRRSQVTRAIAHSQEHVRFPVPRCWLDSYIQFMKNYVPKIPAELIFNF
jgi:hypothetical protein